MMLEWAAEQTTKIATTAIDLEFLPTDVYEGRGVQNLKFILLQVYTMLMDFTSGEVNDTVDNSREEPTGGVATTTGTIRSYRWRTPEE